MCYILLLVTVYDASACATLVIPLHTIVMGYYGIKLVVMCLSVCPSVVCLSIFSFQDNNLSKCQWIFTKLGVCIDIVEIWFGIANGHILSVFDRVNLSAHDTSIFLFQGNILCKSQWVFTKLDMCIDIVEIWLHLDIFPQFLTELSPYDTVMVGYYRFGFLLS